MPLNKRKKLIGLIEDTISYSYGEGFIYYDFSRVTAFKNDDILKFISENNLNIDDSLINKDSICDLSTIDFQRWVQITVSLSGRSIDVYMDGKLARSCILPSYFKVDGTNMAFRACEYGGFGGFISNASVYNYALNPEQIWRLYMAGPGPQLGIMDYVKSIFDPESMESVDYPKQNIVG
jgi:hypothetical protein